MKIRIILLNVLLYLSMQGMGQVFKIEMNQPEQLQIFPGNDTTICKSHSVVLGSEETATGGTPGYIYLWTPSQSLDNPTSPNPIATPAETTKYILIVTDANGCSSLQSVNVIVDQCLGINNRELEGNIMIYPNPSPGSFTLSGLPFAGSNTRVVILNSTGTEIRSELLPAGTETINFDFSGQNLPKGVYFIRIINDQLVSTRRIQLI